MIIGHSRPESIDWSQSSTGTGQEITSGADSLADGRPDTLARMKWMTDTQSTADHFNLIAEWDTPIVPGLCGFSNISLPVGTKTQWRFRRETDDPDTYPYAPTAYNDGQRIMEGPHGERTAWVLLAPGATPVVGAVCYIWNDVDGSADIDAGTVFEIGEAVIAATSYVDIDPDCEDTDIDASSDKWSGTHQGFPTIGTLFRQLDFEIAPQEQSDVYSTLAQLVAKFDRRQPCVWIPRHLDASSAFSADMLHATARIGIATKLPTRRHLAGPWYGSRGMTVIESPIPT